MNKKLSLFALSGALFLGACGNTTTPVQPEKPIVTPEKPGNTGGEQAAPAEAYYIMNGVRVPITAEQLADPAFRSKFVFYAWLEDEAGAIPAADIANGDALNVGTLSQGDTVGERTETAPVDSQNLAASYIGFRADDGKVYPVVGGMVRWDVVEPTKNTIRFATADDGGQPTGATVRPLDVNDNATSALTYTNSSTVRNVSFPATGDFALNNVTGVNTPDVDGFTWTALWTPNQRAQSGQISAVGLIGEYEINKTTLAKTFAPTAKLQINKTVITDNGLNGGTLGVNEAAIIRITVTNSGAAPATNIRLQDRLSDPAGDIGDNYVLSAPAGTTADGDGRDGFDAAFDLAPGETRTFEFAASSNVAGTFCDVATITQFDNGAFGTITNTGLSDDACFRVTSPSLNIIKELVDANGKVLPSGTEVGLNQPVRARIVVSNSGTAPATNVVVRDQLTRGNGAAYAITTTPAAAELRDGDDGFATTAPFTLNPGEEREFYFAATATQEGTYCDQGLIDATYNNDGNFQGGSLSQCFVVTAPNLDITKVNTTLRGSEDVNLRPGQSYNSTITVTNTGSGAARDVAVSDLLGNLNGQYVNFGSGSFTTSNGQTGSLAREGNNIVTAPSTLSLAPGETLTLTMTSTVPAGARAGEYCNVATVNSSNGVTDQATDCITVVSYISEQIGLIDTFDPIVAGGNGTNYISRFIVEEGSNEGADNNIMYFYVGTGDATGEILGNFLFSNVNVSYLAEPPRDPRTGEINISNEDILAFGGKYRVDPSQYTLNTGENGDVGRGQFYVDFADNFAIQPGGVVFITFDATAAEGQGTGTYYTNTRWTNTAVDSNSTLRPYSSEPTTVVEN